MESNCSKSQNMDDDNDDYLDDDAIEYRVENPEVGCPILFQQVESLDQLFIEGKKEKPPKFIGQRYLMGAELGNGSYGKVKQVLDTFTLRKLAVKIMSKQKLRKIPNGEQHALNEYAIMRKLHHKNVAAVYDLIHRERGTGNGAVQNETSATAAAPSTYQQYQSNYYNDYRAHSHHASRDKPEKLYLIMEYCACGLYDLLENAPDRKLPIWQAHRYFCDLLDGMEYLHSRRIIHKDIKPQNLLLAPDETLKITDFGVAEELSLFAKDATIKSSAGTPMFQPPEVAAGKSAFCGIKLDVWCAGITLYNITTGKYPFEGANLYFLLENISKGVVRLPTDLSPQLQCLLRSMLEKNPLDRFSLSQVKSHRWVTQKHCVSPERVYLFSLPRQQQQVPGYSLPANLYGQRSSFSKSHKKKSTSKNPQSQQQDAHFALQQYYHTTDFITSLEKLFNLQDCGTANNKMEADDLMHTAGGGGGENGNFTSDSYLIISSQGKPTFESGAAHTLDANTVRNDKERRFSSNSNTNYHTYPASQSQPKGSSPSPRKVSNINDSGSPQQKKKACKVM